MAKSKIEAEKNEELKTAVKEEKKEVKSEEKAEKKKVTSKETKTSSKKKVATSKETKTNGKKQAATNKESRTETKKKNVANKTKKTGAKKEKATDKENKTIVEKKMEEIEKAAQKENKKKEGKSQKELQSEEKIEKAEEAEEETGVQVKEEVIQIEEIKKTIENKKAMPKAQREKIYSSLFRNIAVAGAIIVYFIFLNLGKLNIKAEVYVTDLKVFSMCILATAIAIIEKAYKKDSGELALYGIETIVLALSTVALIYVELMLSSKYVFIVTTMSYIFAIYYLIKSIVIYIKQRKKYFVDDMKEIIKEEE